MSEATFYKHELASLGMLAGGALAWRASRRASAGRGSPFLTRRDYGPGCCSVRRWGWCSATCCGVDDPRRARVATDLCRLCFTAGRDGADVWPGMENRRCRRGTGGVVGDAVFAVVGQLCLRAVGAAGVIGNVGGMALGSVTAFMLYRRLPWLTAHDNAPPIVAAAPPEQVLGRAGSCAGCWRTLPNRPSLAMSGRAPASLRGAVGHRAERLVARLRFRTFGGNLDGPGAGRRDWRRGLAAPVDRQGWYPTYIPVVSVAPAAVLAYGGTATAIVGGALLGALLGPPLAAALSPSAQDFHPYVGNVLSMAFSTLLIVPALGLLPGSGGH